MDLKDIKKRLFPGHETGSLVNFRGEPVLIKGFYFGSDNNAYLIMISASGGDQIQISTREFCDISEYKNENAWQGEVPT